MYNASTSVVNKGIDDSSNYDKLELITFVFFGLEVFLSVILFIVGFSSNVDEMFIVIGVVALLVSLYGLFHSISLRMDYNCHKPIRWKRFVLFYALLSYRVSLRDEVKPKMTDKDKAEAVDNVTNRKNLESLEKNVKGVDTSKAKKKLALLDEQLKKGA